MAPPARAARRHLRCAREPVLARGVGSRRCHRRRRCEDVGGLPATAVLDEARPRRRPGRASAVRHEPDLPARAIRARASDVRDDGNAAAVAGHAGLVGVVGALLALRPRGRGARAQRPHLFPVLVRALHRLLGGLRGRPRAGRAGHSRRRRRLARAAPRHAGAGHDGARVHAVVCAAPRRDGARARHRRRGAARARHGSRRRTGGGDRRRARPPRGGVGRARVRPCRHDRDGRLRLRVRGPGRPARERIRVHRRSAGPRDRNIRARGRAGAHESRTPRLAGDPIPHR